MCQIRCDNFPSEEINAFFNKNREGRMGMVMMVDCGQRAEFEGSGDVRQVVFGSE